MPIKITAELACDGCGKAITARGRTIRYRRTTDLAFPDLYIVNDDLMDGVLISKSPTKANIEESGNVECSSECACKVALKLVKRLKKKEMEEWQT